VSAVSFEPATVRKAAAFVEAINGVLERFDAELLPVEMPNGRTVIAFGVNVDRNERQRPLQGWFLQPVADGFEGGAYVLGVSVGGGA
jgi:hypothetical protein